MPDVNVLCLLFLASPILALPQSQDDKSQPAYDPQLLSYQLQQLALQQYTNLQNAQPQQFATQPIQFPAQAQGVAPQSQQQALNAQYLPQNLFTPSYQTQYSSGQTVPQTGQDVSLQTRQQLPKQNLLGVAYSSAADASRTSFTGYGVKYSF